MMKSSNVLDYFDIIKACGLTTSTEKQLRTCFRYFGRYLRRSRELPGWKTDMTTMQSEDEFPEEFNNYISFLEEELGVPIAIVSLGPDRAQTIIR